MKKIKIFLMLFSLVAFINLNSAEENALAKSISLTHLKKAVADFFNKIGKSNLSEFIPKLDQPLAVAGTGISLYWLYELTNLAKEEYLLYKNGKKKCSCGKHTPLQGMLIKSSYMLPTLLMLTNSLRLFNPANIKINKIAGSLGIMMALAMLIDSFFLVKEVYHYQQTERFDTSEEIKELEYRKSYSARAMIAALVGGLISYRLLKHS